LPVTFNFSSNNEASLGSDRGMQNAIEKEGEEETIGILGHGQPQSNGRERRGCTGWSGCDLGEKTGKLISEF
jgi:hypothetical protein